MQTVVSTKNAGESASLVAAPRQLAPDIASFVNPVCLSLAVADRLQGFQRPEHWLGVTRPLSLMADQKPCLLFRQQACLPIRTCYSGQCRSSQRHGHQRRCLEMWCLRSVVLMQTFRMSDGAIWIGLNSVANPGAQAWEWVGGQTYDSAVQVRFECASYPTHG